MELTYITNSEDETKKLGEALGKVIEFPAIIALIGDLGTGKTVFTRGLAEALGIKKVRSPSFTLINIYRGERAKLYHIDLYRLNSAIDIYSLGLEDAIRDPEGICVIEWAEKGSDILGEDSIYVNFKHLGNDRREIRFSAKSARNCATLKRLKAEITPISSS